MQETVELLPSKKSLGGSTYYKLITSENDLKAEIAYLLKEEQRYLDRQSPLFGKKPSLFGYKSPLLPTATSMTTDTSINQGFAILVPLIRCFTLPDLLLSKTGLKGHLVLPLQFILVNFASQDISYFPTFRLFDIGDPSYQDEKG